MVIKGNKVLIYAIIWINLKNIIRERNQLPKICICNIIYTVWNIQNGNIQWETASVVARTERGRLWWERGMAAKAYGSLCWGDKNVLKLTVVVAARICKYTDNHWVVHFKRVNEYGTYTVPQLFKKRRTCWSTVLDFFPPLVTALLPEITLLGTRKKTQRKRFTDLTTHNSVHDRKRSCEQRNSDPYLIPLCSSHNPEWASESHSVLSDSLQSHTVHGIL